MRDLDAAYAAGILDGEGNIHLSTSRPERPYWQLTVKVFNSDPRIALWLKDHYGGTIIPHRKLNPKHKQEYRWAPNAAGIEAFLRAVLPYSIIKREQIEIALAYLALPRSARGRPLAAAVVEQRRELRSRLSVLTRRGPA